MAAVCITAGRGAALVVQSSPFSKVAGNRPYIRFSHAARRSSLLLLRISGIFLVIPTIWKELYASCHLFNEGVHLNKSVMDNVTSFITSSPDHMFLLCAM